MGPSQAPIQWVPWVKQPEREAVYLTPSSAEVKNDGALPSLLYMCSSHGASIFKYRDSLILLFIPLTDIEEIQFEKRC